LLAERWYAEIDVAQTEEEMQEIFLPVFRAGGMRPKPAGFGAQGVCIDQ